MTLFEEVDLDSVDGAARAAIRDDLDRNLFVEAGAGTGKTTVLVSRVVNLVASGVLDDPSQLVAITFTEAAAAELRDRIRGALEQAGRGLDRDDVDRAGLALDDEARSRCREARRRIDEAVITTLHGFAQRILAEHPLEAGLPPRFEIDDGVLARVRFADRWSDFLDELYDDPAAAADLLTAHALGLTGTHLLDIAHAFHDRWDRVVEADLTPRVPRPPVDARPVLAELRAALELAGDRIGADDNLAKRLEETWQPLALLLHEAIAGDDPIEILRTLASFPGSVGNPGQAPFWSGDKPTIIGHLGAARELATQVVDEQRRAAIEHLVPRLQTFTAAGVAARRREGVLEFHDLLVHARDLLRTHAEVRVALADRYRVLLIDEFQDTDPIQLDIAFLLAADDAAAEPVPWRDVALAPGKVLIVGDPKQSIYGFRGADISVWDDTRDRFPDAVVQLHKSFRTVPQIVEWVNAVFGEVIGEGRTGSQPRYEELAPHRHAMAKGPAVILLGGPGEGNINAHRAQEAQDVARLVQLARDERWSVADEHADGGARAIRYDDIALLLPTRTPLGHIERALDSHGVPYRVESRSLVWATDTVRELLSVLAAVDDPDDDLAVVAALRSPGFACSDVDLVEWRAADGRWDHRRDAPEGIAADHPVARAMVALRGYHRTRNDEPVDLLVERIIRERSLVALTFAQRRPRDHWRRLRFVVDQARAFVEAGGRSLGELVAWAELQASEGATVVETPAPEADDDAVRILTIHGSKGLEFPMVVLAGLGTFQRDNGPVIAWSDRPEVAVGSKDNRFTTPGWHEAAAGAGLAARDEGRRLLYVAATRARDHLVVGLAHPDRQRPDDSYASELWAVAGDDGPCSHLARRVPLPDQLTFDVGEGLVVPPSVDPGARDRWQAEHAALVEGTHRRRILSATAIAELAHQALVDDTTASDDGDGSDVDADATTEAPLDDEVAVAVPADDGQPAAAPLTLRRGGTARGRAVHGVLQTVDLDEPGDLEALALLHATAEGIGSLAPEVAALATSALGSPTVQAASAAKRRWREVTVAVPLDGGRMVEGYVDLLFEDDAGELVVVDHKTDSARTDAEVDAAAERYRLQLAAYALAVEAAVGRPVARAVLVFARPDGPAVEREVPDLRASIAEARALASA